MSQHTFSEQVPQLLGEGLPLSTLSQTLNAAGPLSFDDLVSRFSGTLQFMSLEIIREAILDDDDDARFTWR